MQFGLFFIVVLVCILFYFCSTLGFETDEDIDLSLAEFSVWVTDCIEAALDYDEMN